MAEPPELGPTLKKLRLDNAWTLDELARKSGVSTSMLSQIERSQANPTFATLWHLTQALGVELGDITGRAAGRPEGWIEVDQVGRIPHMQTADGKVVLRILGPVDLIEVAEWYQLDAGPGGHLPSSPHAGGTVEHLTVLDGELLVRSGGVEELVSAGATARYPADLDHEIANVGTEPARALLVVINWEAP